MIAPFGHENRELVSSIQYQPYGLNFIGGLIFFDFLSVSL